MSMISKEELLESVKGYKIKTNQITSLPEQELENID